VYQISTPAGVETASESAGWEIDTRRSVLEL
jgi:hypothetical protein